MGAEREQWLSSILQRVEAADGRSRNTTLIPRTIYRVPFSIRSVDDDAYTPLAVSIGPYHHQTDITHRLYAMEIQKQRYLKDLLARNSNPYRCLNELIESIEKSLAGGCIEASYSERIPMETKMFTEMMLFDGCFIVELLLKRREAKNAMDDPVYSAPWMMSCVIHDLLLLENQIPFFILQSLFYLVKQDTSSTPSDLIQLALLFFFVKKSENSELESKPVYHLLHLVHSHLLPLPLPPPSPPPLTSTLSLYSRLKAKGARFKPTPLPYRTRPSMSPVKSIPSATRLKEAGIRLRVTSGSFLNITFDKGVIGIPHLFIEDTTNAFLRNLIALEQCLPTCGSHFTFYALFMDFMVNNARDVEILQKERIIENGLGSVEDVTLMFNRMCKGIQIGYQRTGLSELMKRVNEYLEKRTHVWRARLMRDYFGSPWSFLSSLAAIFPIVFAFLQTTFTILSYYNNSSDVHRLDAGFGGHAILTAGKRWRHL